jgi:RNA polymerase-associated protein RTF1
VLTKLTTQSDVSAVLARKSLLSAKQSPVFNKMEKSRLMQARTLAIRRQDAAEVQVIDAQLAELTAREEPENARQDGTDMLARVNERNRKANLEAVRKAELMEAERKRRERKLAAMGGSGALTPSDPSARLKTLPRLFESSRFVLFVVPPCHV